MLDKTSRIDFLRTGLTRYADARETVDYFETTMMDSIVAAFEAKTDWTNFQPIRDSDGHLQFGKAIGPVDRFVHAYIAGALPTRNEKRRAYLSLGVYWNPRQFKSARVVAASQCWMGEKGGVVSFLDLDSRDTRLVLGSIHKRGERRVLLEVNDGFEPVEDFALLLDSADDALA